MTAFKDLKSLKEFLKKDSQMASLNPIRFINVDSMAMWIEVKKYLQYLADESLLLSKFCEGEDTTPNIKRISAAMKKTDKSQLIIPLSEHLRIIPGQAESIIQRFIKGEYQNNENGMQRFYFLMYRMKSLLITIKNDDPRAKDCITLFETDEESDYKLTIVQKELDVALSGNVITGFKRYLEYWEANPDKPLILHTENAIHFEKNHFFDNVHVIVTPFDLIKYQYGLPSGVLEEMGSEENWKQLANAISNNDSFEEACCSLLTINRFSVSLFEKWDRMNTFQRWILWLWTRLQLGKEYVIKAAKESLTVYGFVDSLYCCIIRYLNSSDFEVIYGDRKNILSSMQCVPTEQFWNSIQSLTSIDALSVLTCLTDAEKKEIFKIITQYSYQDRNSVLPVLKQVYPDLYYYLQNDRTQNCAGLSADHERYFSEYKWLKATNTITEGFVSKVKSIALEKGTSVFQMKPRNHYISEHYDSQTMILFVDGMGIEYVDYLSYMFSDLDEQKYSVIIDAGSCTLPSVTEINKDFMFNRNIVEPPIRELDELKHANNVHPESLIKQLQILAGLKNRVLGLLVGNIHRIIIASDHGTSRLAVKVRNTEYDNAYPRPENTEIYKYGRFCEGTEDESKYPTAISYNDRLVFADYSRFVQNGAPIDEIHGGASLEEWIVPIITVDRLTRSSSKNIIIKPKETKFKPEAGTNNVKVLFTVSGNRRDKVYAKVNGNQYLCEWENGYYVFFFVPMKTDSRVSVRIIDREILGEFQIEIEQGIRKNTNFNI